VSRLRVYLQLGRVSNLPTVWSNTLAGSVLAGGSPSWQSFTLLVFGLSLFYVGGMFLNDAFDRSIDARERPERPIPSGLIRAREVFWVGFGLLAGGILLAVQVGGTRAATPASALAATIVLYNAWHKGNPVSPFLMGLCRVLVYLTAGFAMSEVVHPTLWVGALALFAYLIGLTYLAKQENLAEFRGMWPLACLGLPLFFSLGSSFHPLVSVFSLSFTLWILWCVALLRNKQAGNIPRAVAALIAGISLVDALMLARSGATTSAWLASSGLPLTLLLQRYVKGT